MSFPFNPKKSTLEQPWKKTLEHTDRFGAAFQIWRAFNTFMARAIPNLFKFDLAGCFAWRDCNQS